MSIFAPRSYDDGCIQVYCNCKIFCKQVWSVMDISQVNCIYKELKALREEFICTICDKQCQDPVRVKVCGHYFCAQCLNKKKTEYSCPRCNLYYEEKDIEIDNIGRKTPKILSDLEVCLHNIIHNESSTSIQFHNSVLDSGGETRVDNTGCNTKNHVLEYQNKKYKINFIKDLPNKVNAKGETALHLACKRKKNKEIIELLEKKVDINVQDFAGWTPLHEAVESGNQKNIEYLLNHGALINIPGEDYTTPLHKAVVSQKVEVVELLLKHGAEQEFIDLDGKKPVEYNENEHVQKILDNPPDPIDRVEQLFCNKKITPFCYYIENKYKDMLNKSNVKIQETYDKKIITHFIIKRTHKLSLKILIAILDGCTIVPQEWIDQFLKDDHFISIPQYTFIHNEKLNRGIQKSLMNKLFKLPKLFDNMNFYIYGHKKDILLYNVKFTKESLGSLVISGGGKLLRRAPSPGTCGLNTKFPFHARNTISATKCCNYIIYEDKSPPELRYQMAEVKHKSSKWIVDCIISFTIID